MFKWIRAVAACLTVASATPLMADGIDPLYDNNGNFLGNVEIMGDVQDPSGMKYAQFHIPALRLMLFVDPDAAYVMLTEDNPIIRNQTPFSGFWVGYDPEPSGYWQNCGYGVATDPSGQHYSLFGDLTWTNLSYSRSDDLTFAIDLGRCGEPIQSWATNKPIVMPEPDDGQFDPVELSYLRDVCGNTSDLTDRAMGCTQMIGHPQSTLQDVTWALWSRAYVRCGRLAPDEEIVADLMTAVRLDPREWQGYFQRIGHYSGPIDGQITNDLVAGVHDYVTGGCR